VLYVGFLGTNIDLPLYHSTWQELEKEGVR